MRSGAVKFFRGSRRNRERAGGGVSVSWSDHGLMVVLVAETIDGLRCFDQILNMHSLRKSRRSRAFSDLGLFLLLLLLCVRCFVRFFVTYIVAQGFFRHRRSLWCTVGARLQNRGRGGVLSRAWGPEFLDRCSLLGVFSVCFYLGSKNQVSSLFLKDALQLNAAIFRVLQPRSP